LLSLPVFSTSGLSKIKPNLVIGFAFLTSREKSLRGRYSMGKRFNYSTASQTSKILTTSSGLDPKFVTGFLDAFQKSLVV
jgi:hypothetical protein